MMNSVSLILKLALPVGNAPVSFTTVTFTITSSPIQTSLTSIITSNKNGGWLNSTVVFSPAATRTESSPASSFAYKVL